MVLNASVASFAGLTAKTPLVDVIRVAREAGVPLEDFVARAAAVLA